ncbi:FkbM family methyltransferase [Lachnospiraceae bacterium 47-T17]
MKILIWGTGKIAKETIENFEGGNIFVKYDVVGFIDNNEEKREKEFFGKKVFPPSFLSEVMTDKIVILTASYEEIKMQILKEFPELECKVENRYFFNKESLLKRYEKTEDKEIAGILDYIKENGLNVFNYSFAKKYEILDVETYFDEQHSMYWVNYYGHKLYFSRMYKTKEEVIEYYRAFSLEQDKKSPHRYIDENFKINKGDVVVDVGAAEGNFSLEIIEDASKVYIIESDQDWIDALKLTFADYMDKVVIIKGFVSSYDDGVMMTLDDLIHEPVNFIKMDIEGSEWEALQGAKQLINNSTCLQMAVCAYHRDFDENLIEHFMDSMDMVYSTTAGYMWFPYCRNTYSTKLSRAIIRGRRK